MIIKAPAKINLYLEILNKRDDGYHNLESIMHTVSLFDTLEFSEIPYDAVELLCNNDLLPADKTNLVYKAAVKFKEKYGVKQGVKINLTKNIPMGAGLGGGSSDAAAVIKALNKMWKINDALHNLESLASCLGADVPFFLSGGTAKVEGIGETVTKILSPKKYHFVLVKPNFGVSTVYAYSKIKFPLTNIRKIHKITESIEDGILSKENAKALFYNRFEEFIFPEYKEIAQIKTELYNMGCVSLMSGSGATVFGLVRDQKEAEKVIKKLSGRKWNMWAASSFEVHNNGDAEV